MRHLILTTLLISLLLISCAPAYVPNMLNTPMLHEKGEIQATVATGTSGFNAQTAYAITDNVGIMLNGNILNRQRVIDLYYDDQRFIELGGGYFRQLGNDFSFDVYAGAGVGESKGQINWFFNEVYNDIKVKRAFIQPAIGITTDMVDLNLATRISGVSLFGGGRTANEVFFEPALTGKLGYKYVKMVFQLGMCIPSNRYTGIVYRPYIASVGLQMNLGRKWANPQSGVSE